MMQNVRENIFLIGPMGAGKTSIGRMLAKALKMTFYDSDQVVEARAGVDVLWIYDVEGEAGFREREKRVIADLVQLRGIVLATGGSTVFLPENRMALRENGKIVYLKTSLDNQVRRTGYSKKRPLAFEELTRRSDLLHLRKEYSPLYQELADIVCDTDKKILRSVVNGLVKRLR